jgi:uncharacterized membrane protein
MTPETFSSWQVWAFLSAVFAALTAIFAKVGVEGINSDLATLIRTVVVLITLSAILFATGQFTQAGPISTKSWLFLLLSGLGIAYGLRQQKTLPLRACGNCGTTVCRRCAERRPRSFR